MRMCFFGDLWLLPGDWKKLTVLSRTRGLALRSKTYTLTIHTCLRTRGCWKSLARPGRKQTTATKLRIYSIYSPWSSIHFLSRCSNFYKPLKKKKFRTLSVQPGLRGSNDPRVGRKMETFQLFFSVQGTGGSPTGPDPEDRVRVIKKMEAQEGQFLLGCKWPVSRGIVVQG